MYSLLMRANKLETAVQGALAYIAIYTHAETNIVRNYMYVLHMMRCSRVHSLSALGPEEDTYMYELDTIDAVHIHMYMYMYIVTDGSHSLLLFHHSGKTICTCTCCFGS